MAETSRENAFISIFKLFSIFLKHSNYIIWLISKTILIKSCKMYIVFFVLHFNLMVHFRHSVDCK